MRGLVAAQPGRGCPGAGRHRAAQAGQAIGRGGRGSTRARWARMATARSWSAPSTPADAPAATAPLHWPVGARLYLPERWAGDADRREARRGCRPAWRSRPSPRWRWRWSTGRGLGRAVRAVVVADAGYGDNPGFLAGLEERGAALRRGVERTFGLRLPAEVRRRDAAPPPPCPGAAARSCPGRRAAHRRGGGRGGCPRRPGGPSPGGRAPGAAAQAVRGRAGPPRDRQPGPFGPSADPPG